MFPFLSNMLMGLFHSSAAARARREAARGGVHDGSTLRVAGQVWGEVAAARGLSLSEDGALAMAGNPQGVSLELFVEARGPTGLVTRGRARRGSRLAGRLRVEPAAPVRRVFAALRGMRLDTGDAAFDAAYVATATDAGSAFLLDEPTRAALLLVRPREASLEIDGDTIELTMDGVELVHETLHELVDAFVRLASVPPPDPYR